MATQHFRRRLLIGAALLCPAAALAQSGPDPQGLSDVLACADIEREILRLECYDDAVAALRRGAAARERGAAAAESPVGRRAGARPAEQAASADDLRAPPPSVVVERELPAARGAAGDVARSEGGDDPGGDRQVTIVEVRTQVPGRAVFVTSAGEEFVQTSGRLRLFLPDVPFQANLRSGAVGGRFLTPEGTRRSIRISARE